MAQEYNLNLELIKQKCHR